MALPSTKVEIAFNAGYLTPAASRVWTDVSTYVEGAEGIIITRGREDEVSEVQPSRMTLTLNNRDGRFTPRLATGAYYPNVKKWRPIRVTVTYNGVPYVRFTGYVAEWPVSWPDGSSAHSTVTITCVSRTARMGRGAELRDGGVEEILLDEPSMLYLLDEQEGSTTAVDTSGNQGFVGQLLPTAATAPATFGAEVATAPPRTGLKLNGNGLYTGPDTQVVYVEGVPDPVWIACLVQGLGSAVNQRRLLTTSPQDGTLGASIILTGDGRPRAQTDALAATGPTSLADGSPHVVHVVKTVGGAGSVDLYVDGVSVASAAGAVTLAATTRLTIGDPDAGEYTVALIAGGTSTISAARIAAHAAAILDGAAGETSDLRIDRLASYAGIPSTEVSADVGVATIGVQDMAGKTPLAVVGEVVATENGVLYDAKDGTLTFKARDARYTVASSFTLSATAQEVEADLEPKDDDQFLVNDVTAAANGVPAGRVLDQTSIDDNGYYREALDTVTDDVGDALAGAQWRLALGKDPDPRYSSVRVDVVNSSAALTASILTAEIGTRFTLGGLPSQAPAASTDLFVEGYAETITDAAHTVAFNTSPTTGYDVWTLEDPVFGAYDSNPLAY